MATCGPEGWGADLHPINELTVTIYRQCDICPTSDTGCSAHGYCGLPSPYSNRMPAAMLCDRMCQPTQHGNCRPRHIFSELVAHLADQITPDEANLIQKDPDFAELDFRCRTDCIPTVPLTNDNVTFDYACVAWDKKNREEGPIPVL